MEQEVCLQQGQELLTLEAQELKPLLPILHSGIFPFQAPEQKLFQIQQPLGIIFL